MIKTILVCVDGSKYAGGAADAAIWLAKAFDARLRAISVADTRLLEGPWLADLSGMAGAQPFHALVPQFEEVLKTKARSAAQAVTLAAAREGVSCSAEAPVGRLVHEILEAERTAELVVMGQRGEGFETTGEWLGSNVERVVRKSSKPCLVTPATFRPVRRILAAYDGSAHANRAMYSSFDLARALKAGLAVLTVAGEGDAPRRSRLLQEACDLAKQQGVAAEAIASEGTPEKRIVEIAREQGFDLIVMGAYGHTRLRELVLGSVTSYVIRAGEVPVLLVR
ncbi:MAG: universal stress protein [Verrucomicrobiae bacterium]|nr:universal stress protein [Verrucomicrobiae bacterium]